jgi:hypothetical protein
MRSSIQLLLLLVLLAPTQAGPRHAQQPDLELRGSWRATSGPRVFEGTWFARINPKTPNRAEGSWTLIAGSRVTLQGAWAAEKNAAEWRGAWSARVASSSAQTPPMTGTWQADVKDSGLKTLADMLQHTSEAQVNGTWRSGQSSGTWSLVGRPK